MSLQKLLLEAQPPDADVAERFVRIQSEWFAASGRVHAPDFEQIAVADLEFLFDAYDRRAFARLLRSTLGARPLRLRFSRRMTRSAGTTMRTRSAAGEEFEIAIAIDTLFDAFQHGDREITVCGVACASRAAALLRVFEHELTHLAEFLCWGASNCSAPRFQGIARRLFRHDSHTHDLVTRRERAAAAGLRPGARVSFDFGGERLTGIVNRVTKRATVLAPHPSGVPYSDGRRYRKFLVPIEMLEPAE